MKPKDIDSYIASFPKDVQALLKKVRRTIRAAAPKLYPPVRGNAALQKAAAKYAGPKGKLQFPYDEPLPLALITRIVRHQVKEDASNARAHKKK